MAATALAQTGLHSVVGASWTTDAPFRETAEAIGAARRKGILAVEMEAAALYTFARSAEVRVLCLAHVTNTMGQTGNDFEKGEADGTRDALTALSAVVAGLRSENQLAAAEGAMGEAAPLPPSSLPFRDFCPNIANLLWRTVGLAGDRPHCLP